LQNQFPGLVQVEYRHYPLERPHRWALLASTFAECAAEQGKFWEFHGKLFSRQDTWAKSEDAVPFFAEYSQEAGLDRVKLEPCLANSKTLAKIRKEHALGVKQGVQSTPTVFINDHILVGAPQLKAQGAQMITEELKRLKKG
ncbi:MAG: thioredoxin domain-containing protein, partial [Candidatus Omnitrophica bacterium]|nr:thioredoxin domain-containing protein [Candidatus Omnitrophota bacterium]